MLLTLDAARAAGLPPPEHESAAGAGSAFFPVTDGGCLTVARACLERLHRRWPWPGERLNSDRKNEMLAGLNLSVGRYRLKDLIGSGGHGLVFLAEDPAIKRNVALKVPRPESLASDRHRKRFLREARALGRLDHPGVVPIHEFGEAGSVCYLATAFIDGPNLADSGCALAGEAVAPGLAATITLGLAEAVAVHAHARGVLHLDLKPGNVMIDSSGSVSGVGPVPRITDFGLAKLLDDARDANRTETLPFGTPRFMALSKRQPITADRAGHGYLCLGSDPAHDRQRHAPGVARRRESGTLDPLAGNSSLTATDRFAVP